MEAIRLTGNCRFCYYARYAKASGSGVCTRYPRWVDIEDMSDHGCGEYVNKQTVALRQREGERHLKVVEG